MRIGIVGLGKMGLLHASLVSAVPGAQVVAVCEQQPLLRRFGRKMLPGVSFVRQVGELARLGLDGVYVTTPPGSHYPVVSEILAQGAAKHVFVEKPLAASADEARALLEMARRLRSTHMVGYQKRFAVTFRKAKDILGQGLLGDLLSFDAYAFSSDFSGAEVGSRRARARGGVLRDLGCHAVDVTLWFFDAITVTSASYFLAEPGDPFESVSVRLSTASGLSGTLSVSSCMSRYRLPEIGLSVVGTRGRMSVSDDRVEVQLASSTATVWHRHTLQDQVPFLLAEPEYAREDECFLRGIAAGVPVAPDFDDGLKVETAIDEIQTYARHA